MKLQTENLRCTRCRDNSEGFMFQLSVQAAMHEVAEAVSTFQPRRAGGKLSFKIH